jgi:hypothetical protein
MRYTAQGRTTGWSTGDSPASLYLSQMTGAPYLPGFGLSGIPPRWTGSFLSCNEPQVHDHLHPEQSAVEVGGTPLKPKPGLNGAPSVRCR